MTHRKIIKIAEALCNGCGNCVTGCSEGALQIVNGKARLVSDSYCDGFGDCIGTCPTGALTIEERPASDFDIQAIKTHLLKTRGVEAIWRMEETRQRHLVQTAETALHSGCPAVRIAESRPSSSDKTVSESERTNPTPFKLDQWPIHLRLVQPGALFFKHKELVLMSTCAPLALADGHQRFLKDRSVVVACPKLDDIREYVPKLAAIFQESTIPGIIIPRMEVPCCSGLTRIAMMARQMASREDLVIQEYIIGIDGTIKEQSLVS